MFLLHFPSHLTNTLNTLSGYVAQEVPGAIGIIWGPGRSQAHEMYNKYIQEQIMSIYEISYHR
jgi:hypothetical protein